MTFEELKAKAEQLGFTFELQTWEFDDYILGYDEKEHWYKGKATQFKVTFPPDWPRPFTMIDPGNALSIQRAIEEYRNRHQILADDERRSREVEDALSKLSERLNNDYE